MALFSFKYTFFITIPFLTLLSCTNVQDKIEIEKSASSFDIKQGEAPIMQSNQNFMKAFKNDDSVGVVNCFTTDAKLMCSHQPSIEGKENIRHYFSNMMRTGIATIDLKTSSISGDSSILAEEGTYLFSDSQKKQIDKGKYIVLWKQEAGNWKMYRDMWTSDLPSSAIEPKRITLSSP
jgi:ketosteroid isomerase-like protein